MDISIHAPRTGSDFAVSVYRFVCIEISIHAPRTGSDASFWRFLRIFSDNFNPRSPHGERRFRGGAHLSAWGISIHAPRTGSDLHLSSALSAFPISIHAPRTGSDSFSCPSARAYSNFNPRSPHGERRSPSRPCWDRESYFNPRSPHGERHCYRKQLRAEWAFQSTLPARGATRADYLDSLPLPFQSTLPARGATRGTAARGGGFRRISIHAPRTGSDSGEIACVDLRKEFQSTLPARGATRWTL